MYLLRLPAKRSLRLSLAEPVSMQHGEFQQHTDSSLHSIRRRLRCLKTGNFFRIAILTLTAILIGEFSSSAAAQRISASIVGTVTDPQGRVVIGADVNATNLGTGAVTATTTNSEGIYVLQHLPVGSYTFSVDSKGFNRFTQNNIVLSVEQTLTLNVALEVGSQTQSIVVTSAPSLVNTATAQIGQTIEPRQIIGLPLVNRNVYGRKRYDSRRDFSHEPVVYLVDDE